MSIRKFYEYEGLGGGIDPKSSVKSEMTQTMTKEQILWNIIIKDPNYKDDFKDYDEFLNEVKNIHGQRVLAAMSDWEQQQLSAERERSGKLEHALKMCVDALKGLDATDYVAYTAGKVALIEYQQTLNEYDTATK